MGMWEIMQKGGLVMWPIALCSVVAVVIIVERLIYFRRIRVDEQKLINRLEIDARQGAPRRGALDLRGQPLAGQQPDAGGHRAP